MAPTETIRIDFVCVHNAGRSQMAAAFAERERVDRGLEGFVDVRSGGTDPADAVHETVVDAMAEVGVDVADRTPKYVDDLDNLEETDYLVTMGCPITKFNPERYGVESREWDLTNPDGKDVETVRGVRDEIETRVVALFDEIERAVEKERAEADSSRGVVTAIRDALSR